MHRCKWSYSTNLVQFEEGISFERSRPDLLIGEAHMLPRAFRHFDIVQLVFAAFTVPDDDMWIACANLATSP